MLDHPAAPHLGQVIPPNGACCMPSDDCKRRVNWVFTYGASKGYISYQLVKDEGSLDVDEVHSTSDGTIVYRYIHLNSQSSKCVVTL